MYLLSCYLLLTSTVLTYKLDISTGNLPEAGTSATVYAMLVGERGDTGQRKLLKPLTAENVADSFQQGQVFTVGFHK